MKKGDRVAYSREFLRSTLQHTGRAPFIRGVVVRTEPLGTGKLCIIKWDDGHQSSVQQSNLVREDRLHLERS